MFGSGDPRATVAFDGWRRPRQRRRRRPGGAPARSGKVRGDGARHLRPGSGCGRVPTRHGPHATRRGRRDRARARGPDPRDREGRPDLDGARPPAKTVVTRMCPECRTWGAECPGTRGTKKKGFEHIDYRQGRHEVRTPGEAMCGRLSLTLVVCLGCDGMYVADPP